MFTETAWVFFLMLMLEIFEMMGKSEGEVFLTDEC